MAVKVSMASLSAEQVEAVNRAADKVEWGASGAALPKAEPADTLDAQCRMVGLPNPEREWRFHETRRWRFDLAYPKKKLAIEVEGGIWRGGKNSGGAINRHGYGKGMEEDCLKYSEAVILGWRVMRITSSQVRNGSGVTLIERAYHALADVS